MEDYQSNARKDREQSEKVTPDKHIERVTTGDVIVQKKSLGRKFRDIFIEADFGSVGRFIVVDVIVPTIKNMIVDGVTEGVKRTVYGEPAMRRRNFSSGTRVSFPYNRPVERGYTDVTSRLGARPGPADPRLSRHSRDDLILSSREEAEIVVSTMHDIIDQYDVVSVADLNEMVGIPKTYMDNTWGWTHLGHIEIRQIREGYLIDLPPSEPLR